jgi:hypothetical protein
VRVEAAAEHAVRRDEGAAGGCGSAGERAAAAAATPLLARPRSAPPP